MANIATGKPLYRYNKTKHTIVFFKLKLGLVGGAGIIAGSNYGYNRAIFESGV